jgi:hypothetical protein
MSFSATQTRLGAAALASFDERGTTCCYAKQDKFWVEGAPDGERWEIYTVLEDSETFGWATTATSGAAPQPAWRDSSTRNPFALARRSVG